MTSGPVAVRLRLDIAYDGTSFSGWASQPDRRTVQGTVEAALARVLGLDSCPDPAPRLTVAGRTDAGVHAHGQVAHVDVPTQALTGVDMRTLVRRLAGVLPADVRVRSADRAPEGFDARFSVLARRYTYSLCDGPAGVDPLRRHEVLWHRRVLDVDAMDAAARLLEGEHDFAAYCRRREGATTLRRLLRYRWSRTGDGLLVADVEADAFCHNMVRAIVGAVVAVGEGRRSRRWPADVLARGVRDPAVTVVAPHGLCLVEVRYPPDDELAARARATRRLRAPRGRG
ncbi:MAG: tRNA pseudouridine(38-40) synthase TruA [Streptosporangiaceae bacterium]